MHIPKRLPLLLPLTALCCLQAAPAQSLVANLVTGATGQPSSGTDAFFVIGNRAVFAATGPFGAELYATDGTPTGTHLLADLAANGNSSPQQLVVLGNEVLFAADVPGLGRELWKTDGTTAGTMLVKDIRSGAGDSNPAGLVAFGSFVYFSAIDGSSGFEIWRTDGTSTGTEIVVDLQPGFGSSSPDDLTVVGNTLFFHASANGLGRELYTTDGTLSATLVADLSPAGSTSFTSLAGFGNQLLFGADVGSGAEPWISDGTTGGTLLLGELQAGAAGSLPESFTEVGNLVVFTAEANGLGRELYVTDGTTAGTALLADLRPGAGSSDPRELTAVGSTICFSAFTDTAGREPWRTDGLATGTFQLLDLAVGAAGSNPGGFTLFGSELWFAASGTGTGEELFRTDGSSANTGLVADLVAGTAALNPRGLTAFGTDMLFRGSFGGAGVFEPCITDGTLANTALLDDVASPQPSSQPALFAEVAGDVFFVADTDGFGREPHRTNGTPTGTTLLADVQPGLLGLNSHYRAERNGDVFFDGTLLQQGTHLFVTDGSVVTQLTSSSVAPRGFATNDNLLVFSGTSTAGGRELWISDGTATGTFELIDIRPGTASSIVATDDQFVTAGGKTYFVANDGSHGKELWCSDGTATGTVMVVDLQPGAGACNPSELTAFGDELYFTATVQGFGNELWRTDGTAAGTQLVVDLRSGFLSSSPRQVTAGDGVLFFTATANTWGEIYVTDGTALGTVAVTNTGTGQVDAFLDLTWTQAGLFFVHDDLTSSGRELWRTTGSLASTQLVADTAPGQASGVVADTLIATLGGTQLLFAASDLQNGLQLWLSDGTTNNTKPVTAFGGAGYGAVSISDFYSTGSRTFFAADDGVNGVEPWLFDPANGGVAFVLPYGTACAGTPGEPVIAAAGLPTVGNGGFAVTVQNALPATLAIPVAGSGQTNIPVGGGCRLLVDFPFTLLPTEFTDASGSAATAVPVPNNPSLVGANLFFQWAVLDGAGPFLDGFAVSGGLQVQVGG